jgi:hypothetical protein
LLCGGRLVLRLKERRLLRGQICDAFVRRCEVLPSCEEASEADDEESTSSMTKALRKTISTPEYSKKTL